MNQDKELQTLQQEKQELQNQLARVKADHRALQAIHQSTNERLDEQEKEIQTNESHILELVEKVRSLTNQISVLMEANEHLTFVQILQLNLKYIYQIPVPVKLVLGGTVAYKVYGRYSKSNDSNTNSPPTFSLLANTNPDVETLAPKPKSYQKVVEVSAVPIQQIQIPNNGIWLPF